MLLEYNNFINKDYVIEVINGPYWDYVLNEHSFLFYHRKYGNHTPMDPLNRNVLKTLESQIEPYIKKLNPFTGEFLNVKTKKFRTIDYEIETTEHWYERFLRNVFEDPKFLVPNCLEGINIIYENRNEITDMIDRGEIQNKYRVLFRAISPLKYSIVVIFEKINTKNYKLKFQSQMKGEIYKSLEGIDRIKRLMP